MSMTITATDEKTATVQTTTVTTVTVKKDRLEQQKANLQSRIKAINAKISEIDDILDEMAKKEEA